MTAESRLKELEVLVSAGRRLAALGYSPGRSGNVSVRDKGLVYMSPTNSSLGDLDADSLSVLDLDTGWVSGSKPSKEFALHRSFYCRLPNARCVVHLHSAYAVAASCLAPWSRFSAIPPLTPYFVMNVGQAPLIPYFPPGDERQAEAIESLPFPFRAALLQNHGSIVGGPSVAAAVNAAMELEEACKTRVLLGGLPYSSLSPDNIRSLTEDYGTDWMT